MSIAKMSMNDKVSLLKELYYEIAGKGQDGDTMLAHINPEEALLLKAHGGSGTINPNTGLPEYKKAVKTVVKVAAVAAAVYYGGPALMSAMAPSAAASVGTTAFWAGANTAGFAGLGATLGSGLTLSNAISGAGLLSSVAGNVQSQKYIEQGTNATNLATAEANKADEARNRYNQLQSRLSRYQSIRYARISQGKMEGSLGALGSGGTSSYTGSVGSVGTQTSANLGNINVAEDVGNQISGFNTAAANYGSQANTANATAGMWTDVATLGNTALTKGKDIASIFGLA